PDGSRTQGVQAGGIRGSGRASRVGSGSGCDAAPGGEVLEQASRGTAAIVSAYPAKCHSGSLSAPQSQVIVDHPVVFATRQGRRRGPGSVRNPGGQGGGKPTGRASGTVGTQPDIGNDRAGVGKFACTSTGGISLALLGGTRRLGNGTSNGLFGGQCEDPLLPSDPCTGGFPKVEGNFLMNEQDLGKRIAQRLDG